MARSNFYFHRMQCQIRLKKNRKVKICLFTLSALVLSVMRVTLLELTGVLLNNSTFHFPNSFNNIIELLSISRQRSSPTPAIKPVTNNIMVFQICQLINCSRYNHCMTPGKCTGKRLIMSILVTYLTKYCTIIIVLNRDKLGPQH